MREIRGNEIAMIFQEPMTSLNPVFTIGNQIAEAENRLQMLKAEQSILAMKRKQLEANAARAQRMAEERLAAAEKALAAAELTPQEEKTDA
jgi:ABC-type dipeptide/oligopeptide/nickel transport system ATPase component